MKRMKFRAVAAAGGASDVGAVAFGIVYAVLLTVHMSRELAAMQKGIVGALFAMMGILGHAIYIAAEVLIFAFMILGACRIIKAMRARAYEPLYRRLKGGIVIGAIAGASAVINCFLFWEAYLAATVFLCLEIAAIALSLYLETMAFCYLRGMFAAQEKNG